MFSYKTPRYTDDNQTYLVNYYENFQLVLPSHHHHYSLVIFITEIIKKLLVKPLTNLTIKDMYDQN